MGSGHSCCGVSTAVSPHHTAKIADNHGAVGYLGEGELSLEVPAAVDGGPGPNENPETGEGFTSQTFHDATTAVYPEVPVHFQSDGALCRKVSSTDDTQQRLVHPQASTTCLGIVTSDDELTSPTSFVDTELQMPQPLIIDVDTPKSGHQPGGSQRASAGSTPCSGLRSIYALAKEGSRGRWSRSASASGSNWATGNGTLHDSLRGAHTFSQASTIVLSSSSFAPHRQFIVPEADKVDFDTLDD